MLPATYDNDDVLADKFREFLARPTFPCVGAKSALSRNQLSFVVARDITRTGVASAIWPKLWRRAGSWRTTYLSPSMSS